MARMLGRAAHDPHCDCESAHVGPDRCSGKKGKRRHRQREERTWRREGGESSRSAGSSSEGTIEP